MLKKNMNSQNREFSLSGNFSSQKILSILVLIVIAFGAWLIFDREDIDEINVAEIAAQQESKSPKPATNDPDEIVKRASEHVIMYGGSVAVAFVSDPPALQGRYPGFFKNVQKNDFLLGQDDGSIIVYSPVEDKIRDIIHFKK